MEHFELIFLEIVVVTLHVEKNVVFFSLRQKVSKRLLYATSNECTVKWNAIELVGHYTTLRKTAP